jgi:hypothetical protein
MAADPQLEPQNPGQATQGPQDGSQDVSGGYLDQYGHPSRDYVQGCLLKAIEACKTGFLGSAEDPEAAQKYGSGAFGFAQAYEKIAGKAAAEPDPVKLAQLEAKVNDSQSKQGTQLELHAAKLHAEMTKHMADVSTKLAELHQKGREVAFKRDAKTGELSGFEEK